MLYLDYAKPVGNGYILNFFADKIEDIQEVSGGKEFVTKNGTNYGVPLASSTVVITYPDKSKKTFVLNGSGEWEESREQAWIATVINLGTKNPDDVSFVKSFNFPTSWEEVSIGTDVFIKLPKTYRKINLVEQNQITSFTISNMKLDDNYKIYPCFIDENGNELDYVLVGKYLSKSSDTCNSVALGDPVEQQISNGRAKARAKGMGYQLMDWRIQKLWQDLLICAMETIDTNHGAGIEVDKLGIYWGEYWQFVDGVGGVDYQSKPWVYSNFPSKYIDNPTSESDGYVITTYVSPESTAVPIKCLGYETSEGAEFFNYPTITSEYGGDDTYYCDWYDVPFAGDGPVLSIVGSKKQGGSGAFNVFIYLWDEPVCVRLCYRPVVA